jgi:hypothetical protein
MEFSNGDNPARRVQPAALPALPQVWIGYALGIVTILAEVVAVELHPELANGGFTIPPLYLFLSAFVGGVYWMVCVYQYHVVLANIRGWKHPISPARAVGFHFLPLYNFYWVFKWPQEIARFVNWRLQKPLMKPQAVGIAVFAAFLVRLLLDPGLGLILLFVAFSYVSECLRRALASPAVPVENLPPPTD